MNLYEVTHEQSGHKVGAVVSLFEDDGTDVAIFRTTKVVGGRLLHTGDYAYISKKYVKKKEK